MEYKQYTVPKELRHLVRYFWSYDSKSVKDSYLFIKSFADKYPRLIFQDNQNFHSIMTANGESLPLCYLSGLDTKPSSSYWLNSFSHFGVSFYPYSLHAIWGINAQELCNKTPNILDIDTTDLPQKLLFCTSHLDRVKCVSAYFLEKMRFRSQDNIMQKLFGNQFNLENENLQYSFCKENKISERQLQRNINIHTGTSFKKNERINRFENALTILPHASFGELAQIAYSLGYTDQSHFIKDFKSFSGCTPLEFINSFKIGNESSSFIYDMQ